MFLDQIGRPHKSPPKYKQLTLTQTVLLTEVLSQRRRPSSCTFGTSFSDNLSHRNRTWYLLRKIFKDWQIISGLLYSRRTDNPAVASFSNWLSLKWTIYGEDVYVGYRYYEKTKKEVNFPFGHGLSYTEFGMSGLQVSDKDDDEIVVEVDVTNKGKLEMYK
jgi:hypothetical protein